MTEASGNSATRGRTSDCSLSSDVQSDAVSEGMLTSPRSDDKQYDPNLFEKINVQKETTVKTTEVTDYQAKNTDDDKISVYAQYLPKNLKFDYIDILILCTEDDEEVAISMKESIENNVTFCNGLQPYVTLLKDVIAINDHGDILNDAVKRTLLIMLYVTEEFCNHTDTLFKSNACLNRVLNCKEKEYCSIIPVHTVPNGNRKYELPVMLDGLRPLKSFSKSFHQDVKKLLEFNSEVILERRAKLREKREKYISENESHLDGLRQENMIRHNGRSTFKLPENPLTLPLNVSASNTKSHMKTCGNVQEECQVMDSNQMSLQHNKATGCSSQKQRTEQHTLVCPETCYTQQTDTRLHMPEVDNSLSITTDSPTEVSEKSSLKHRDLKSPYASNCDKNCYSSSVQTPTITYKSLPEPAGDTAVPEIPATHALNAATYDENDVSHIDSQVNMSEQRTHTDPHSGLEDIIVHDGSSQHINESVHNTVPNITVPNITLSNITVPSMPQVSFNNFPNTLPHNLEHDEPVESGPRHRSPNLPVEGAPSAHYVINIRATNVAIGKHSKVVCITEPVRDSDDNDSDDSET